LIGTTVAIRVAICIGTKVDSRFLVGYSLTAKNTGVERQYLREAA
jgi:hypothetical protein